METIEGFVNFVYLVNFWAREQAQSQVCQHAERITNAINRYYRLASSPTKQMVSNEWHKRERKVNQSHASGNDSFNGAEEVALNGLEVLHRLQFGMELEQHRYRMFLRVCNAM